MKNFKIMGILLLAMTTFFFTSCSDDMSKEEIMDEFIHYSNDLQWAGYYGSIQKITQSEYADSEWKNGKLEPGYVYTQTEFDYNTNGFITKKSIYESYSTNSIMKLRVSKEYLYNNYDSKNRPTEILYKEYDYNYYTGATTTHTRLSYTYNDETNTATMVGQSSTDGNIWKDVLKRVYNLNKAGRINDKQFQSFASTRGFAENPNERGMAEYDEKGNVVLEYVLSISTSSTTVNKHTTTSYIYY